MRLCCIVKELVRICLFKHEVLGESGSQIVLMVFSVQLPHISHGALDSVSWESITVYTKWCEGKLRDDWRNQTKCRANKVHILLI